MSQAEPSTLYLVIGAAGISCAVRRGAGARAQWSGHWHEQPLDEDAGIEPCLRACAGALQALPALPALAALRVLVAERWLAAAAVPWSAALQRAAGAGRYARAQLGEAGFEIAPQDTLRIDDAPFEAPRLALAYPAALLDALGQMARALDTRLESVLPLALAAWSAAGGAGTARAQALAIVDDGSVVIARGRGGRLAELTVRAGAAAQEADARALPALWQRLCLRDPQLDRLEQVGLLDLRAGPAAPLAPAAPFVPVDFVQAAGAPARTPALALAARIGGMQFALDAVEARRARTPVPSLVAGAAAVIAGALLVQALQAASAVGAYQARLGAAGAANARPLAQRVVWSAEERARVASVNMAVRELNLPLSPILRALEPPPDIRVAVLGVETAAGSGAARAGSSRIRLVAQARSSADMARYVAFVAQQRRISAAFLSEHEIDETSAEQPYRFTVEALWRE